MRDISDQTILKSLTEAKLADWLKSQGTSVVQHRDRYWQQTALGFWEPIHWLACLDATQATPPTPWRLGFRATLKPEAATLATGSMPVHLMENLELYDLEKLHKNTRNHIRKAQKSVHFVELITEKLLKQQGYEVVHSALTRTGYAAPPTKEAFLAELPEYCNYDCRLIIAGIVDGKLGGYLTGYAVDGTAYLEDRMIDTDALKTDVSIGLTHEFIKICQRSPGIHRIVSGQHVPEATGLIAFKAKMGFQIQQIPALVQINPVMAQLLKVCYPSKYYRLTGSAAHLKRPLVNAEAVPLS